MTILFDNSRVSTFLASSATAASAFLDFNTGTCTGTCTGTGFGFIPLLSAGVGAFDALALALVLALVLFLTRSIFHGFFLAIACVAIAAATGTEGLGTELGTDPDGLNDDDEVDDDEGDALTLTLWL